jgi:hypothetical protein
MHRLVLKLNASLAGGLLNELALKLRLIFWLCRL